MWVFLIAPILEARKANLMMFIMHGRILETTIYEYLQIDN